MLLNERKSRVLTLRALLSPPSFLLLLLSPVLPLLSSFYLYLSSSSPALISYYISVIASGCSFHLHTYCHHMHSQKHCTGLRVIYKPLYPTDRNSRERERERESEVEKIERERERKEGWGNTFFPANHNIPKFLYNLIQAWTTCIDHKTTACDKLKMTQLVLIQLCVVFNYVQSSYVYISLA